MCDVRSKLTVFFDEPFWVGVYERSSGGRYEACRVVFGAEPKDNEVYAFFLENWRLLRFSPPVREMAGAVKKHNPKRIRREAARELAQRGAGTK